MNDDHDLPDDGGETGEHATTPAWPAPPPPAGPPLDDFSGAPGPVQPVHPSVLGEQHEEEEEEEEEEDPNPTAAFEPVAAEPEPATEQEPSDVAEPVAAPPQPEPTNVMPVVAPAEQPPAPSPPVPAPATAAAQPPVPATAAARADTGRQEPPIGGQAPGFDFGSPPDGGDGGDSEAHPLRYFLVGAALGLVALAAIFGVGLLLLRDTGPDTSNRQASVPATPVAPATTTPARPATTPKTTDTAATPPGPPADLSPALAGAKLTTVALGPIRVGMTLDQATTAAGTELTAAGDTGDAACRAYAPAGGPEGAQILVASDIVTGFAVSRNTVPTLSGVKIGDTADQVRSTYGDRIESAPGDGGETLTYVPSNPSDTTRLVFETDANNTVVAMRAGQSSGAGGIDGCG